MLMISVWRDFILAHRDLTTVFAIIVFAIALFTNMNDWIMSIMLVGIFILYGFILYASGRIDERTNLE